jgi:hypothetical protein
LTPTSIAPSTSSADHANNVLRLLQTVDTDNDPSNGITLPQSFTYANLSFNKSKEDFEAASTAAGHTLVSESTALAHYKKTLDAQYASDSYKFNLAGKTAKAYYAGCTNEIVAFTIKFETDTASFVSGTDSVDKNPDGSCTAKTGSAEGPFPYSDLSRDGFLIPCQSSVCTMNQLNNVYQGSDVDGRTYTQTVSHIKNSKIIISTKSWDKVDSDGKKTRVVAKITLKFD